MKRISLFVAFFALCLSLGISAYAQNGQITVSVTSGGFPTAAPTKLMTGGNAVLGISFLNDMGMRSDVGGAFRIYSAAGKIWDSTRIAKDNPDFWAGANATATVMQPKAPVTEDTLGYIGAGNPDPAMADGFNGHVIKITIYGLKDADTNKVLCIDTSTTYTGVDSRWVTGDLASHFPPIVGDKGTLCWTLYKVPYICPTVTGPASFATDHCTKVTTTFGSDNPNNTTVTFGLDPTSVGTINPASGAFEYQPALADAGKTVYIKVYSTDGGCTVPNVVTIPVVVSANVAATIQCPDSIVGSKGSPTVGTITAVGGDCDPLFWGSDLGTVTGSGINNQTGNFSFTSADSGHFTAHVYVTDGSKDTARCTIKIVVQPTSLYGVWIPKVEDNDGTFDPGDKGVHQGQFAYVPVILKYAPASEGIGGFDLLIGYDNSALALQSVEKGDIYSTCGWEYFSYRFGANGNCGSSGCPTGMVRVIGMAETNDGPHHPTVGCPTLGQQPLSLFRLKFLVTNDRNFGCQFVPIRFFWIDCGDNGISNFSGTKLFAYAKLYDFDQYPIATLKEIKQPVGYTLPGYVGLDNSCPTGKGDTVNIDRNIDFIDGGIDIICADQVDDRGDLNMNGVANEIADAVMFTNYFIYGPNALLPYILGATAASDVNADGLTLTVADLVYLIRIIVGDAQAYPAAKVAPVEAMYTNNGGTLNVSAEMGAALVVVKGNVVPENLTDSKMAYAFDGTNTRVLIYPSTDHFTTFSGNFLRVNGEIVSVEFGSAAGSTVVSKLLPSAYALNQNYPNPFNPATTISFALPTAGTYNLAIYNVTGQKVAEFNGTAPAGNQSVVWNANDNASGIYFYKLTAGNFTATKKMVLVK